MTNTPADNMTRDQALQQDYNAITNFNCDWSEPLREKYNLTHDQILGILDL